MARCKEGKRLDFPCSEGFTGTLEKSIRAIDGKNPNFKKPKLRR